MKKIPTPDFYSKISELIDIFDEHTKGNQLQYSWSVIRDHLFGCQMYMSANSFLIRPVIPPTLTHKPFANAKQRIYMSATLGEGGDLERISGVSNITRLNVGEWDKQGIGRRFFMFPETSLDEEEAIQATIDLIKNTDRSLVLVPNDREERKFKEIVKDQCEHKIFNATEIESSKEPFIHKSKAVAIVANRYDGIDLPDDECRLLIVKGIQKSTNLQEKFLVTRMPAGILFTSRILARTIQAVGRCTRSDTDYAAVVILGEDLSNKYLLDKDRQSFLHPEIQAELYYGYENSKHCIKEDFLENLDIFLEHGDE